MEYAKPCLSLAQQADKLIRQGLIGSRAEMEQRLACVSYYRLSAYWHPFRCIDPRDNSTRLLPGTSFELVWTHYLFDRKLRLLFMDAIERIEIALRSRLVDYHTRDHSPFDYANEQHSARRARL